MKLASASRPQVRPPGFTLIELVVVLVLMSILCAAIIPSMRGTFEHELLRSTSRTLISAMALASSQSITVNQHHRLRLDTKAGRYVIERAARDLEDGVGFAALRNVPGGEGELDKRVTIEIRKPSEEPAEESDQEQKEEPPPSPPGDADAPLSAEFIAFYPDGTAEAREIVLRDREGFGLALRINPTTARVKIVELNRK